LKKGSRSYKTPERPIQRAVGALEKCGLRGGLPRDIGGGGRIGEVGWGCGWLGRGKGTMLI